MSRLVSYALLYISSASNWFEMFILPIIHASAVFRLKAGMTEPGR
ncbi:hypothetical protein AGR7B_Cc70140 [Agrobacterium deltaense RV3]|nr:hypothetical protein AGR7B_Cc70140 [Agrobacterium deltaense RV3]